MGSSCSKLRSVDVVEGQRPVRKVSVKNGRQPTPPRRHRQLAAEQHCPNNSPSQDSTTKIQQTDGEEDTQEQVEAAVHGESKETTDVTNVEQKKEQTSPNNEHAENTVAELQETIGEHDDQRQADVHDDSKETTDVTTVEQKKERNIPNNEGNKDTVVELQETIGEQDDHPQAEIHEDSKEIADATAVEQKKEQTTPDSDPCKDTATELKETIGEQGDQGQAEVHEESKETTDVTAVEQKKEQTTPDSEPWKDNATELQETIGEQGDQGQEEVHGDLADPSVQNNEGASTTIMEQKTPKPRTKKDLIPDLEVFKDLDERAVQAPEGHATIKDLVLYLIETAETPLEKARVLFRWVTSHIQYAVDSYVTGSFKSQSTAPAAVFQQRMSVCQGYSDLYKEMCSLADVKCVTISGRSKGGSYQVGDKFGPNSDHAWNAVEIDGRWYLLDCTWAAGNTHLQKRTFEFEYNEHYFFTDPEVFVTDHHPMDNKWQLLEELVPLNIFENQAHFESSFFNLGLLPKFLSPTMSPVCTQNGEATISIKIPEPMTFKYDIYPYEGGCSQNENVLLEIVDNVAMFQVAPAQKGKFLLQIYGKKRCPATRKLSLSQICSYVVDSAGPMPGHVAFPRLETSTWGPGPWLLDGFISDVSHPKAIVTLPEGEAKIELNSVKPLQYMCNMKEDGLKWSNYAIAQVNDLTASVYVRAPKTGQFTLTIWVKEEGDKTYSKSMYYLLKCNKCKTDASPYPKKYNSRCLLYEPLDGRLAGNRRIHFRVVCPNSEKVVVIANGKWQQLVRNANDSWEGDADTGEQGKILSVSRKKPGEKQYWTLLEYEVVA
ncbi:kyphoscoliosis peptidase-like [Branchiostoma lanceolatum]|uniref:kyphoscoliosis peptidase-like n=1 Tax=Branchiostoma lanceolatum TaxID=7740 RepID=UPI003455B04F